VPPPSGIPPTGVPLGPTIDRTATPSPAVSPSPPRQSFPISGSGVLPESAMDLLSNIAFFRGRHDGQLSVVFPGAASFRVPIAESGSAKFDYWPEHSWLTLVEPGQRSADFYDVDISSGERVLIGHLANVEIPVDEELAVSRDPTGNTLIVAGTRIGVLRLDIASGGFDVVVPGPTDGLRNPSYERKYLKWSPTGASLASPRCDDETCVTEIISTTDWTYITLAPFIPEAITDTQVIGQASRRDLRWQLVDLASGEPAPVLPEIVEGWNAYSRSDGSFVADGGAPSADGLRLQVFELDPVARGSGLIYDVLPVNGRSFMYEDWTSPDWVLLLGPENDELILVDTHTRETYDETLHTVDHPEGLKGIRVA
jgi:hypothetical protein